MDNGIVGMGSSDAAVRARTVPVQLVKTGASSRFRKVNTYARVMLEDSARKTHGDRTVRTPNNYVVGSTVQHRGRFWEVGHVCKTCYASRWTVLRPIRGVDEDGPLPSPIIRECPHRDPLGGPKLPVQARPGPEAKPEPETCSEAEQTDLPEWAQKRPKAPRPTVHHLFVGASATVAARGVCGKGYDVLDIVRLGRAYVDGPPDRSTCPSCIAIVRLRAGR